MSLNLAMAVDLYTHTPESFFLGLSLLGKQAVQRLEWRVSVQIAIFQLCRMKCREDSSHSSNIHCLPSYLGILL